MTRPRHRTCGIRFSALDAVVIVLGAIASAFVWQYDAGAAVLIQFILGHFFLFCNVFRVRRGPELVWAGLFLINAAAWALFGNFNAAMMCVIQIPVTLVLLWRETRMPWYHGVACRRLNSEHIEAYLRGDV